MKCRICQEQIDDRYRGLTAFQKKLARKASLCRECYERETDRPLVKAIKHARPPWSNP